MAPHLPPSKDFAPTAPAIARAEPSRDLFRWHLGWLFAAALGSGLLLGLAADPAPRAALALVCIAVAAGFGLSLGSGGRPAMERPVVLVWALAGFAASALTGGIAGPLAAWLLAPVAAAAAMGRVERLAFGAALSAAAIGGLAVAGLAYPLPQPQPSLAYALQSLSLMSMALGFGAAMIMLRRRMSADTLRHDETEARMRDVLDQAPVLLLSLYPTGRVISAHGRPPLSLASETWLRRSLVELAAAGDAPRLSRALRQAAASGEAELEFQSANDADVWLTATIRSVRPSRLVAAVRDTSAQHLRTAALEEACAQAEAQNAGKSRFLANMSHELRTPLNAIMGFSDIMRQRLFGAMPDRYGEYAGLIHESGAHLLDLINDVLDMSKIEAERFELVREEFDAREAVSAVLRLMRGQADRAGVQLRGVLPREPLEATADRRALKQIALNLISNALKFTPRGGAVTVTLQADREVLELVVSDTGVGISADDLTRLGKPFEQAGGAEQRAAGTGLGLSLVRAFAELHDGEMTLDSNLGEGSTVTVRMPVLQAYAPPPPVGVG